MWLTKGIKVDLIKHLLISRNLTIRFKRAETGGLEMDSSNKLAIVLGRATVKRSEIEPKEWLEIVKIALAECKPRLKYFPKFQPIKELLNCRISDYSQRVTDEKIVVLPKEIALNTPCVTVESLSHGVEGDLPDGQGAHFFYSRQLLLTQEGQWLEWLSKYERQSIHGQGYRQHRTGTREEAVLCEFSLVTDDRLLQLMGWQSGERLIGMSIIQTLRFLAREGVSQRMMRI